MDWKALLQEVEEYCIKEGISISYEDAGSYATREDGKSIIIINKRLSPKSMLYELLHEVGHIRLFKKMNYKSRFEEGLFGHVDRRSNLVIELEEEVCAWWEGFLVARRLGLDLERSGWEEYKTKCITGYIKAMKI